MRQAHDGFDQRGASLIEIMVALALGLFLLVGLYEIYFSSKQSYLMQGTTIRRQENSRYVTYLLEKDLRMAGYRGCLRDTGQVLNTLNTPTAFLYNFSVAVQGFDAQGTNWNPALDASVTNAVQGTDVLTIRSILDPGIFIVQEMPNVSADLKTNDNIVPAPLAVGDIAMVTDCGGSAIFQVTNYTQANGNIVHNTGIGIPGNFTQNFNRRYTVGSMVFKLGTVSYYIRNSAAGTGPALWRRINSQTPEELAQGVQNLQVQYGEDTNNDQFPDVYRSAGAVSNWLNVQSVRVALLVASTDTQKNANDSRTFNLLGQNVGPFADGKLRRVITLTISLRNRLQ